MISDAGYWAQAPQKASYLLNPVISQLYIAVNTSWRTAAYYQCSTQPHDLYEKRFSAQHCIPLVSTSNFRRKKTASGFQKQPHRLKKVQVPLKYHPHRCQGLSSLHSPHTDFTYNHWLTTQIDVFTPITWSCEVSFQLTRLITTAVNIQSQEPHIWTVTYCYLAHLICQTIQYKVQVITSA